MILKRKQAGSVFLEFSFQTLLIAEEKSTIVYRFTKNFPHSSPFMLLRVSVEFSYFSNFHGIDREDFKSKHCENNKFIFIILVVSPFSDILLYFFCSC